jgi:hypothetical protein
MTQEITDLLSQVPGGKTGDVLAKLDEDTREALEAFKAWLTSDDGKSEATARAYKTYVAQAIVHFKDGGDWDGLSTDQRSGVRAFGRYSETLSAAEDADEAPEA